MIKGRVRRQDSNIHKLAFPYIKRESHFLYSVQALVLFMFTV